MVVVAVSFDILVGICLVAFAFAFALFVFVLFSSFGVSKVFGWTATGS